MKVSSIDILRHPEKLDRLATKIYENLIRERAGQKSKKKI